MPHCLPYEDIVGGRPSLSHMAMVVKETRPTLYSSWLQHPVRERYSQSLGGVVAVNGNRCKVSKRACDSNINFLIIF